MSISDSGVWLVLGAIAIAVGACWQMWLESGQQQVLLRSMLQAMDELSKERQADLRSAQGVRPWNLRKRRMITRIARDETMSALNDHERRLLDLSNRAGWAWSFVCAGSLATAVGALLSR